MSNVLSTFETSHQQQFQRSWGQEKSTVSWERWSNFFRLLASLFRLLMLSFNTIPKRMFANLSKQGIVDSIPLAQHISYLFLSLCFSLFCSCHNSSATLTSATWGQLQSHVPHFHPQQWSHMFVKMCMLCAFSGPICSHAFSPMSPALPGGRSRSLTLFIQTEQLGPSQPKQWGMGREIIMETSG